MIPNEVDEKLKETLRLLDECLDRLLPSNRIEGILIIQASRIIEAILGRDSDAVL